MLQTAVVFCSFFPIIQDHKTFKVMYLKRINRWNAWTGCPCAM